MTTNKKKHTTGNTIHIDYNNQHNLRGEYVNISHNTSLSPIPSSILILKQ